MMNVKSEKLKKFEHELQDLQEWLRLGLVPKNELEKHKAEIENLRNKINEEVQRLQILKESGDLEEFTLPKKSADKRPAYQETATMSGFATEDSYAAEDTFDLETDSFDAETGSGEEGEKGEEEAGDAEDDEDPFSDKNRWRRGILEDPDADNW